MKKIIYLLLVTSSLNVANAGFNGVTHHSRANCANNESISWDATTDWYFYVRSEHIDARSGTIVHTINTGWQYTWRDAAVHFGEGRGGWKVQGYHWMLSNRQPVLVARELVDDCSIYDGWWDKK